MATEYEPVIGLEIHAELQTASKMFCACPVVDPTEAAPNSAVCEVCAGMPGVLPVVNQKAVEYAVRVALALNCQVYETSIFARKNYFYPDLPKGFQISQYEQPLARNGYLPVLTRDGENVIRIRRVHLEEDTGKLTHVSQNSVVTASAVPSQQGTGELAPVNRNSGSYSLVDLNRAGVPLLEIVTEPDMHSPEEVRACAETLRSLLRYLEVNSGDMQKGVMRIEPNISVRRRGSDVLGTRVEIKNLNSFRALERATAYEIERQIALLEAGQVVQQQTVGWDDAREVTFTQRLKETEDDYRYFPEPDLPPLVVEAAWVEGVRRSLPELPFARLHRFLAQYGLSAEDAAVLVAERLIADYFETTVQAAEGVPARITANWISGALFGLLNESGQRIDQVRVSPQALGELLRLVHSGVINQNTGKQVLAEMFASGESPTTIIAARGLEQISDSAAIRDMVSRVLAENPGQVAEFLAGKEGLFNWLFGQVMRQARGQANPQLLREELAAQLESMNNGG